MTEQKKTTPSSYTKQGGFQFPIRVYYEDTDAGGVVYHSNYINFFERARTEWLRAIGFEQDFIVSEYQIIFVVRTLVCDYLKPAKFNDELLATADIKELSKAKIIFNQTIIRITDDGESELLAKGNVTVVAVDSNTFKPKRLPSFLVDKLPA